MNFEFSEEQNLLREQARGFLDDNCPLTAVRKILEGSEAYDQELWKGVAEMGWMSAVIPEQYGGLGLTYYELSVIAEELGRALAPIPFSSSIYLASEALLLAGTDAQKQRWLPKLATGEAIGTLAFAEGAGRPSPSTLSTVATTGGLTGSKTAVPDGDVADFAVVVAKSEVGDGASMYLVELADVERNTLGMIDPTRSHAHLVLDGSAGELIGGEGSGWELLNQILNRAAVLFAWEQVGGSEAALEQAKAYAMERYAFGRPIAGFQAIKHKLANVYVKKTLARSNCYYGAWALSEGDAELPLAAATCRVSSIQSYYFASKENIQTHGGMGFTWEFDCQMHYRRAKLLSVNIGSEAWWQDRLVSAYEQNNTASVA